MPLIRHCRFTAIDFESAGTSRGGTDSPVQIGLASWSTNLGHHAHFVSFLHTTQPILWSASKVHGISSSDLAHAPSLLSLWPEIHPRLANHIVVAHGKGTEKRFLRAFPGHGFGPWIDTLLLARAAWPHLPNHSLSHLCDSLHLTPTVHLITPNRRWHDALFDATASLVLLAHLIDSLHLANLPADTLAHPDTSSWTRQHRHPKP